MADLIHAETEMQRRRAIRDLDGGSSKKFADYRQKLLRLVAQVEAFIDFSESDEIEVLPSKTYCYIYSRSWVFFCLSR